MKRILGFLAAASLVFSFTPSANADFTVNDQDVTAYTGSQYTSTGQLRRTASGVVPGHGDVAMRKDANISFGSVVKTSSTIVGGDGQSRNSFSVVDWGVATSLSPYAIDLWWGYCRTNAYSGANAAPLGCSKSDATYTSALNFGMKKRNLTFYINNNLNYDDAELERLDLDNSDLENTELE
ncbi:hypothetical protein [Lysinibacillus fusiformis]|uniref:hypothetical protein n=1 Tax=Lysinibacillus fusiformis TaxID=28031 RepID=UPI0037FA6EC5